MAPAPRCGDLVQAAPMRPAGPAGVATGLVIDTRPGHRLLVWWFGLGPPELVATAQTVPAPEMRRLGRAADLLGPAGLRGLHAAAAPAADLAARAAAALT
ncbi:hypothetical protein FZ103_10575 [Streptomonospora sp. PA3]|uniref:hypothetical protein n=1 Tax=Streptomonospora sp. PA3 TaxID=2607326 RepID=UPI0012DC37C0|nr:hypothetical protein [Streptomonospora sp. PA3]MUL41615.1 hypothetical protein [Streptomonospora sp. PA3]